MKYRNHIIFMVIVVLCTTTALAQTNQRRTNANRSGGSLVKDFGLSQVSPEKARDFISRGWVGYRDFGAKGDGKTDDIKAIAATHAFANEHGLKVKAEDAATYYIGKEDFTVEILTDTDFGKAAFIIDDTDVANRNSSVFSVNSTLKPIDLKGVSTLKKNQERIPVSLSGDGIVTVTDSNVKRYIRFGPNQNNGSNQTDIFAVDKNGVVDKNTPIIWDFDQITEITFLPMDEKILTISGGRFTTIANKAESKYTYYNRGLAIRRSNVVIDGLEHHVTGEGDHGAPYGGFINIGNCANVMVKNTLLTGRKMYQTIGSAGVTVSMGSYDISVNRAMNVTFENCRQTNDINDRAYWGILGSNYCKNLVYDNCIFSRFDAHMGVANATIRNSKLGHQGINAIGCGIFIVENSTITSRSLINLRDDYGSTWQGEMIIRDCVFVPTGVRSGNVNLIGGSNSGQHDFGYTCYMPEKIIIENLKIEDADHPSEYDGAAIFANFNREMKDASYVQKYPYITTKEVILRNVNTASGKPLSVSNNTYMFKDVIIRNE